MTTFLLDGVEVCDSDLSQWVFRAAPCGFLVNVTAENQRQALNSFKDKFSGLRVSGIADLSFLADFPNLRYLEILDQPRVNTRPLDGLANLRGLRLHTPGTGLDFSCFAELETFVGDWHADNTNLHLCPELRQLRVWNFKPKSLDLTDLANTIRLEWLQMTKTNITSLTGLETLEDLRYCDIAYAPKLESVDTFTANPLELRELSFRNAKRIASYAPLATLRRLRRLRLSACAPMSDLTWTAGMNQLDFFSFVDTNVVDGDLSPLLDLPKLRYAGMMDKRHHNYKFEALNELLRQQAESGK